MTPTDTACLPPKRSAAKASKPSRLVNGTAYPDKKAQVTDYGDALQLLLAVEAETDHDQHITEELPAIISHWLQSPDEPPVLLPSSYADKWKRILCTRRESPDSAHAGKNSGKGLRDGFTIDYSALPFPPQGTPGFRFIDLFAGIGGFRIALQQLGGKCVFSSEWDRHAKETYYRNYGEIPFGDITKFTKTTEDGTLKPEHIPAHQILCAGFPCQPFSQAGRQLGFDDARGTLFFDILTIAKEQKPKVLFLENVKRLKGHDKGRTFKVICNSLREIGYKVYAKVIRAYDHGVPQNRERIFIVAFSEAIRFEFPSESRHSIYRSVGDVLEREIDPVYTISDRLWAGHQRRLREHREKGNGFGYSLFKATDEYVNTISARYWKDGSEILIHQDGKNPRILTPRECARIQGYPETFRPHTSKRYAYQQFGNSVAVPVISAIAKNILKALHEKTPVSDLADPLSAEIF